jgi:hypothetical protein
MWIITAVVAFLGGWRNLVAASLIAGAVGTSAYYVNQYDKRGRELARLEITLKQRNHDLTVLRDNIVLANKAAEALNERLKERDRDIEAVCMALSEIDKDTDPGADSPVGSPVDRALELLKKREAEEKKP